MHHIEIFMALFTFAGAVYALVRKILPWVRNVVHFLDDITGESARPGSMPRPGLLERQALVEEALADIRGAVQQLRPNGGGSMRDQLNRMDRSVAINTERLGDMQNSLTVVQSAAENHSAHASQAEIELRAAVAALQHAVFNPQREGG